MSTDYPPGYDPPLGPDHPVQKIRPAERGGDVWLLQDNEDPHRWTASWIDGQDGLTDFAGIERKAKEWADTRPAEHWYVFDPDLDDWVEYRPDALPGVANANQS